MLNAVRMVVKMVVPLRSPSLTKNPESPPETSTSSSCIADQMFTTSIILD